MIDLANVRENIFRWALPNLVSCPSRVHGWRLLRTVGETHSWIDVPAQGDGLAVLGSRQECDLVLTDDPWIADRHLAAVVVRSREDALHADRIRLIDLETGVPMFTSEDEPRSAVVGAALSVRVGHHVLYVHPVGPTDAVNDAPHAAAVGADEPDAPEVSCPRSSPRAPAGATSACVRLAVDRRGFGASVELPLDALDDGILLGRGFHCLDPGLRRVLDHGAISSKHLLLLRDQDELFAFDLCSTNGTRVAGRRVRRHRITPTDTLELGRHVTLRVISVES